MWEKLNFKITDIPPEIENVEAYRKGNLKVLKSTDHGRTHLSISHPFRYPTWDEIKEAREHFLPINKFFVMAFTPPKYYVNVHPNCFHLWECLPDRESDLIWTFSQS